MFGVGLYLNRRQWPFTALNSWTGSRSASFNSRMELHLNRRQPNFFEFAIRFKCSNGAQGSSSAKSASTTTLPRLASPDVAARKGNDAIWDLHRKFVSMAAPVISRGRQVLYQDSKLLDERRVGRLVSPRSDWADVPSSTPKSRFLSFYLRNHP